MGYVGQPIKNSFTKGLYQFEGNANDDSGNGNNGVAASVLYGKQYGKFGQGANDDGLNSDIPIAGSGLNIAYPLTVNVWVRPKTGGGGAGGRNVYSSDPNNTVALEHYPIDNHYQFDIFTADQSSQNFGTAIGSASLDLWDMVTWVYNGAILRGYINGELAGSKAATGALASYDADAWKLLAYSAVVGGGVYGAVDALTIEQKEWTAKDVKNWYAWCKGKYL